MATREELEQRWAPTSGLPLDGVTATIIAAEFGYNDRLPGRVGFKPTFSADELDEDREEFFTIGDKGTASADGTKLVDMPARLPGRSNYGRIVSQARELLGDDAYDVIGDPYEAAGWVGTTWLVEYVTEENQNPVTGETKETSKLVLTKYEGKVEVEPRKKAKAKAKVTPAEQHGEIWDSLVAIAAEQESHDDFMDAAIEVYPEVEKDVGLRKAVYTEGPGSIWHEAHK